MADFVLIDGDQVNFEPAFGIALVDVQPGRLGGSGSGTVSGKALCLDGDEKKVVVAGCTYKTAVHTIPGTGSLKIAALAADQKAQNVVMAGKALLLKGSKFTARFEVASPAQQPPPGPGSPIPDPMVMYSGSGSFVTTNQILRKL